MSCPATVREAGLHRPGCSSASALCGDDIGEGGPGRVIDFPAFFATPRSEFAWTEHHAHRRPLLARVFVNAGAPFVKCRRQALGIQCPMRHIVLPREPDCRSAAHYRSAPVSDVAVKGNEPVVGAIHTAAFVTSSTTGPIAGHRPKQHRVAITSHAICGRQASERDRRHPTDACPVRSSRWPRPRS